MELNFKCKQFYQGEKYTRKQSTDKTICHHGTEFCSENINSKEIKIQFLHNMKYEIIIGIQGRPL